MGTLRFNVSFRSRGTDIPANTADLLRDLTEPLMNIMRDWAEGNKRKFDRSKGAEQTGMTQAAATEWQAVTQEYYKEKHGANVATSIKTHKLLKRTMKSGGYPDWLMVRTGELMRVMTDPGAFYQSISSQSAAFGTPQDTENMAKVAGNWQKRQVLFLDQGDMRMISGNFHDYLNYGHNYKEQKSWLAYQKWEESNYTVDL